jgi:hypothetical protein
MESPESIIHLKILINNNFNLFFFKEEWKLAIEYIMQIEQYISDVINESCKTFLLYY